MLTGLLMLVLIVCAFTSGWRMHARKSIDYKKRWQEANALLKEERMSPLPLLGDEPHRALVEQAEKKLAAFNEAAQKMEAPKLSRDAIWGMSNKDRYEAEGARLEAGLPPIDDLQFMSSSIMTKMLKRRASYGIG